METLTFVLNIILHVDQFLNTIVTEYGAWTYFILFLVVFAETGLVIFPFLPGDSLLFAAGSFAANSPEALDIKLVFILLTIASIVGNKVNYSIGRTLGNNPKYQRYINPKHLQRTHEFYEKHGGKTIIMARFLPIIRTFAPFVAGIGQMSLATFSLYNVVGALLWTSSLLGAGYIFGQLEFVKTHFTIIIYLIIGISILPALIGFARRRKTC